MSTLEELLQYCVSIKSNIGNLTSDLQQLNWKSCIRQKLLNIKSDIIKLKQKEEHLMESNKNLLLQIHESSKQLEKYQSSNIIVDILYLDEQFCIVNKPANVVIDGEEEVTLEKLTLNTLHNVSKVRHCHQLDRATSGILVYGLTQKAAAKVSKLFQHRNVIKIYYAIVYGHVALDHFIIDFPLSNTPNDPIREMIANSTCSGRAAITECFVQKIGYLSSNIAVSLIKVHLHTGRRHQIRLHLAHCGHPIIGDPTYSNIDVLKAMHFDRMYLDSYRIILDFKDDNKVINVATNSKHTFDALIKSAAQDNVLHLQRNYISHLLFPKSHSFDTFHHTMIIPFIIQNNDVQILIKKSNRLDMVHYTNNKPRTQVLKSFCWNFVCEARLQQGHSDSAQSISQALFTKIPQCASYLIEKSNFASSQFCVSSNEDDCDDKDDNIKYLAHHLASNIRRGSEYHCTILCSPYVIFMVPFANDIIHNIEINQNRNIVWCSLTELCDEILCYSPLHLISVNNINLRMDPLLHFILSNDYISSQKWMKQQRMARLTLTVNKCMWIDTYQNKKQRDNEAIKVLDDVGIYVGSIKAAKNIKKLKELNITHIVDCTAKYKECITNGDGFIRLCIPVQDTVNDNIVQYMDECLEFINNALSDGHRVLVHCWQGASRSVAIIIGYLMKYHHIKLKDALHHIAEIRGGFARPNTAFLLQLIEMEKKLFQCNSFHITPKQMKRYQRKLNAVKSLAL